MNARPDRTSASRAIADGRSVEELTDLYRAILEQVGEDPSRDGLLGTPERAARAISFLTKGYRENLDEVVNNALFESGLDEIVIVKDIELYSLCEHHILPFLGKCHVGYLPQGRVLGLSKVARIVDMFARRLQIQESLTQQIAQNHPGRDRCGRRRRDRRGAAPVHVHAGRCQAARVHADIGDARQFSRQSAYACGVSAIGAGLRCGVRPALSSSRTCLG